MAQHKWIPVVIILTAAAVLACTTSIPFLQAPGPSGSIIFQTDRDGNFEIYRIDVDGTGLTRLTNNTADDLQPAYIPALQKIGFISDRSGEFMIYSMELDGQSQTLIPSNGITGAGDPAWSPDGSRIAFSAYPPECQTSCNADIFIMDADGRNMKRVIKGTGNDYVPEWSPDGQKILFMSDLGGDYEILVADADGSHILPLTDNELYDGRAQWSPDGGTILFESEMDGNWEIFLMNRDGSSPKALTANGVGDWMANWSPDGNWFVYVSLAENNDIYILNIDGQDQIWVIESEYDDNNPVWGP